MAHQMSPPSQGTFSPYQSNPPSGLSSPGGFAPPPNKRPRLSPNPITNPASPNLPYLSLPNTSGPLLPFNAPQPLGDMTQRGGHGSMGPPQLPVQRQERADKSTDINDLSDIISAAGIDVREEENYLAETYRNQHQPTPFTAPFNSQSSSTLSPNNSFNAHSQGVHGAYGAYQGPGPASQLPVPRKTVEDEINEKHRQVARARNESRQQHLRDPFLTANIVRHRLHAKAYENGVKLNVDGLYDKLPEKPQVSATTMTGPDGTGVVAMKAPGLLTENAPLVDVLSLISLASNERLRGLLEDAFALSRGRQTGSHGTVPPEWSSLALGDGPSEPATAVPISVTRTAWDQPDSAVSPMTVTPQKRPHDIAAVVNRLPTPPTEPPSTPVPTISFSNPAPANLRKLTIRDRQLEEARIAARAKRQKAAQAASDSPATPSTPLPSERAPEVKMTKKERDRLAKAGQTDEVLHKQSNATAALALGGLGGKKYSWMTGGAAVNTPGSGIGTGAGIGPGRINTAVGGANPIKTDPGVSGHTQDRGLIARDKRYGEWREDGPKGKGVQIRDWIESLETDGKEKKGLVQALSKLRSMEL